MSARYFSEAAGGPDCFGAFGVSLCKRGKASSHCPLEASSVARSSELGGSDLGGFCEAAGPARSAKQTNTEQPRRPGCWTVFLMVLRQLLWLYTDNRMERTGFGSAWLHEKESRRPVGHGQRLPRGEV